MEYEKEVVEIDSILNLKNELEMSEKNLSDEIGTVKFLTGTIMFFSSMLFNYLGSVYQSEVLAFLTIILFVGTMLGVVMLNGEEWNNKLVNNKSSWLYRYFKTRSIKKVQGLESSFQKELEQLAEKLKGKTYQYEMLDYLSKASPNIKSNVKYRYDYHLEQLTQNLINQEYTNSAIFVIELMEMIKINSGEFQTKNYLEELKKAVAGPKLVDRL